MDRESSGRAVDRAAVRAVLVVGIFVLSGLIFRAILIPQHFSQWAYGDAQMYNAGVHFANEGFVAHYFLPEINPGNPHSFIGNNGPNGRYSHYPALHAIVNGLLIKVAYSLGVADDVPIKQGIQIVYLLLASIGIWAYFAALRRLYGDLLAAIFGVFLFLSPWLTGYGDSLCDQPLNILLSGLFFLAAVTYWDNLTRRMFSPSMAIAAFLLSRNSIEMLPVVLVFSLLYGMYMSVGANRSLRFMASQFCSSVVAPISIGLAIHFYQSYLDFGDFKDFYAHWTNVYTTRFDVNGISVSRTSYFWQYLTISVKPLYFMMLLAFLVGSVVIFVFGNRVEDSVYRAAIYRKLGFMFSFGAGFISFPLLFPQQALNMRDYASSYVYVPIFLVGLVMLALLERHPAGLMPDSWRCRRLPTVGIRAAYAFATLAWIAPFVASVSVQGITLLTLPLSVTEVEDHHAWGFFGGNPQVIASFSKPEIRRAIGQTVRPTDILVFPVEQQGADLNEANSLIEFYLQRHAVVSKSQDDLRQICKTLNNDRLRLTGSFEKYVVPNVFIMPPFFAEITGAELAKELKTYSCQVAAR